MATIQWRPELNPLTVPVSYRIRYLPRNVASREDVAAEIAQRQPGQTLDTVRTILNTQEEVIRDFLLNGDKVTLQGFFSYALSFTGRLDDPEDPLPPLDQCLQVGGYALPDLVAWLRDNGHTEKVSMSNKVPLLNEVGDTLLKLDNVLNPDGVLQIRGEHLYFDAEADTGECVIRGTESGEAVQTRLNLVSNIAIMLMPDVPAQSNPWNNEYTISVSTHYSEHGTLRTGTYGRMLRTPLAVPGLGEPIPPETGILSGDNAVPYVGINGGTVLTEMARVRIQAVYDPQAGHLMFTLLDMKEGGAAGVVLPVTQDEEYILHGYAGSPVSTLEFTVNDYAGLVDMIRSRYNNRLVDILDVSLT